MNNKTVHDGMTDDDLIGYVELHCRTERALFHSKHIKRLFALAGEDVPNINGWYEMHADVADPLIAAARERARA